MEDVLSKSSLGQLGRKGLGSRSVFSSLQNLVHRAQFIGHGAFSDGTGTQNRPDMSNKAYNNHGQLYRGVGPVIRNLSFISKTCNAIEEQKSSEISELSTPIDILCETGQLHIFFHAKKKSQPRELT